MAASNSGVNVLRYSALFAGITYGLYHQSSINSVTRKHQVQAKYEQQSSLIDKAKAEWTKKTAPSSQKPADSGVITDPDDPKFDLEAYLTTNATETEAK